MGPYDPLENLGISEGGHVLKTVRRGCYIYMFKLYPSLTGGEQGPEPEQLQKGHRQKK